MLEYPKSEEAFLKASGGKSWLVDLDNQRNEFFCDDDWILKWFNTSNKEFPTGGAFQYQDRILSFVIELDGERCAVIARRSDEKGDRGYFAWSSDLTESEREGLLTVPVVAEIGEADVPPEAILSRARGLAALEYLLANKDVRRSSMFRRCTW